jgi:hypothetical protein
MTMVLLDSQGLPILGAKDPAAEGRAFLEHLAAEKQSLADDDHDWVVLIMYSMLEADAERAAVAKRTGVPASPPIPLGNEVMRQDIGPLCSKCEQHFIEVQGAPCPGMSFEAYLKQLPPEVRSRVIERLQSGEVPNNAKFNFDPASGEVTIEEIVDDAAAIDSTADDGGAVTSDAVA